MPMILRTQDYEDPASATATAVDMTTKDPAVQADLPPPTQPKFQDDSIKPLQLINDEGFNKKRVGPKRKPEKSRIVRVRKSDEEENLKCSYCLTEVLSYEDLLRHEQFCRRSPNNVSPRESSEPPPDSISGYRPASTSSPSEDMSPDNTNERPSSKEGAGGGGGCAQVLKLLQEAVPHMNGSHQMALEMILNAQMSLSRMALNSNERDSPTEGLPMQPQQLLQLQLIQLLQAQLTMNNNNNKQPVESDRHLIARDKYDEDHNTQRIMPSKSPVEKRLPSRDVSMSPTRDFREEIRFPDAANGSLTSEEEPQEKSKSLNMSSLVIQHSDSPPPSGVNTLEMLQRTADEVLNNATKGLLASRLIDSCNESDSKDPDARHRCRYCAKIFNSDSALQIHIRSHTGERPFKCNICGNRFTTKGNLKVHFQRHSDRFPHIKMNGHPVPESLDKFYPPLLQQMGELDENSPQNDGSTPQAAPPTPPTSSHLPHPPFSLSPTPSMSQTLKNLENQPPLNLKSLEATLFRPSIDSLARSFGKEKDDRFFDFRLFPQVFADRMKERDNMAPLELDKKNSKEAEKKSGGNTPELIYDPIKQERMDEDDPDYNKKEVTNKVKNKSYQNHTIESLLLSRRRSISDESLNDARSIYKNIMDLKGNFRQGIDDVSKHNQNSPIITSQISDTSHDDQNDNQGKGDDHENTTSRDDVDPYLSDGGSEPKEDSPNSKSSSTLTTSPIEFSHIPFLGMPLPPNLPLFQGLPAPFPNPHMLGGGGFMPHNPIDPARNPTIYNNLLPRPGSTDNSWEALIEVDKSNESAKVERLVGNNIATEPNQCAICQRVLSCKSALHMHYRTHTGERPFKCRICSRAFTTKGNLKTHMSVHRSKPPMRMFHQCSVCHKRFSNGLILQQHIKLHTGEPTDLTPEQISIAEIRDFPSDIPFPMRYPPFQPNGLPSPLPPRNPFPPLPLSFPFYMPQRPNKKDELVEGKYTSPFSSSPRSSSASSAEQQSAEDLSMKVREEDKGNDDMGSHSITSPTPSDFSDIEEKSQGLLRSRPTSLSDMQFGEMDNPIFHPAPPPLPLPPLSSPATDTSKVMFPLYPPLGIFSPIRAGLDPLQAMHNCLPPMPDHPGNTTCKICFKIFACQSALEIHYRSHTKERPFKCPVCDRGFSTKGNMKQHLSTHKSSEYPADYLDRCSVSPPSGSSEDKEDTPVGLGASSPLGEDLHLSSSEGASLPTDEDKGDLAGKRERDPEREGSISLPEAKRSLGSGDGASITPEEGHLRRPSEIQGQGHPLRSFPSPPLVSTPSMILPLPPSLSIPASISHLPFPGRLTPLAHHPLSLSFPLPLNTPTKGDSLNL